jgi:phosphoesterase RecJ-like protein
MESNNTKGRLILEGHMLSSIETWFNDSVAISCVSHEWMVAHNITQDEASGIDIANMLRSVIGWNIGITMMEKEPGHFRLSFRSRDAEKYDVSKIATVLKGGGHSSAAGATVVDTLEKAKNKVKEAISEALGLRE